MSSIRKLCKLCGTELSQRGKMLTEDCGGDCLSCMARVGDPYALDKIEAFFMQDHPTRRQHQMGKDPKQVIKDAISAAARGSGGIAWSLGREGWSISMVDSADSNAVHIVVPVNVGAKGERVFKVTVSEVEV